MSRLFQVYLVPAAVFVSVVIGGGYGTGREVVEFFTQHGLAGGLWGLALAAFVFALVIGCTYEYARTFELYDYRSFFRHLIGPFWILFEILYVMLFLLVLAVVSSGAASILQDETGLNEGLGLLLMLSLVALVVAFGRQAVERIFTFWFLLMYAVFALYFISIITHPEAAAMEKVQVGEAAPFWWQGGLLYPMYNLAIVPALLFSARHFDHRGAALGAALLAAVLVALPALLFHVSYAAGYPRVLEESVPNYWMIKQFAAPWLLSVFLLALFGTLVQTGVGMIHGVIERLESVSASGKMPAWQRSAIAAATLGVSGLLGLIGIVDLIGRGYSLMAVGFALVYVIPVCTIGVWRLGRHQAG